MNDLTFREFQDADVRRIDQFKNAKGGMAHIPGRDGGDWTNLEWSGALCGEAGELANYAKKERRGDCTLDELVPGDKEGRTLRQCISDECADVVAYAAIIVHRVGVDLGEICRTKFNRISERVKSDIFLHASSPGSLAKAAYERYCADAGNLNFRGEQCPAWNDLPQAIRDHWVAAVRG